MGLRTCIKAAPSSFQPAAAATQPFDLGLLQFFVQKTSERTFAASSEKVQAADDIAVANGALKLAVQQAGKASLDSNANNLDREHNLLNPGDPVRVALSSGNLAGIYFTKPPS